MINKLNHDMRIAAGPAMVTLVNPSTVMAAFCEVRAANAMPVMLPGMSAVPTPLAMVTFEYVTGFAWLTQPMNRSPVGTFEAVNVTLMGGTAGAVTATSGDVTFRDGRIGSGSN